MQLFAQLNPKIASAIRVVTVFECFTANSDASALLTWIIRGPGMRYWLWLAYSATKTLELAKAQFPDSSSGIQATLSGTQSMLKDIQPVSIVLKSEWTGTKRIDVYVCH